MVLQEEETEAPSEDINLVSNALKVGASSIRLSSSPEFGPQAPTGEKGQKNEPGVGRPSTTSG